MAPEDQPRPEVRSTTISYSQHYLAEASPLQALLPFSRLTFPSQTLRHNLRPRRLIRPLPPPSPRPPNCYRPRSPPRHRLVRLRRRRYRQDLRSPRSPQSRRRRARR